MSDYSFPLARGERVLWTGAPRQGLVARATDIIHIPFGLVWTGFAVFWIISALRAHAPLFFALFGLPFVLIGLFVTVGRFFWDRYIRARTTYAVTTDRVLVQYSGRRASVLALNLSALPAVRLELAPNGSGTILFAPESPSPAGMDRYQRLGITAPPKFEMIDGASAVYEIIRKAAERARPVVA